MLKAVDESGKVIIATNADDSMQHYCPTCGEKLIYKNGLIKIAHFAHHHNHNCRYMEWEPESLRHIEMKQIVMRNIKKYNNCIFSEYEYPINNLIADAYFEIFQKGYLYKIAVECQVSPKSLDDFIYKTRTYSNEGVYTLWLFDFPDSWLKYSSQLHNEIRVPAIMKEAHKWYYGRVYTLWDNKLVAVHFKPVYRDVEYRDEYYSKYLKTVKEPYVHDITLWKVQPTTNTGLTFEFDNYLLSGIRHYKFW